MSSKLPTKQKGRGAENKPANTFNKQNLVREHLEGLDEEEGRQLTQELMDYPKTIVNKVGTPDIPLLFSLNPYQGCEHGCVYCYARNSHEYYGFSAGLDFESRIMIKPKAAQLLRAQFDKPSWVPAPVSISGNTDCYQPLERKWKITRSLLHVFLEYKNPVGIITKNDLMLRDLDLLESLAAMGLVHVYISITGVDESIRRLMEPRTSSYTNRFKTIEKLSEMGVPVTVMMAPLIPFINTDAIPKVLKRAADAGALGASYTMVRLNGKLPELFTPWIEKHFPDRAHRVLESIKAIHGGSLSDSRIGTRMKGEGELAKSIRDLFRMQRQIHFGDKTMPPMNTSLFQRPGQQLGLLL